MIVGTTSGKSACHEKNKTTWGQYGVIFSVGNKPPTISRLFSWLIGITNIGACSILKDSLGVLHLIGAGFLFLARTAVCFPVLPRPPWAVCIFCIATHVVKPNKACPDEGKTLTFFENKPRMHEPARLIISYKKPRITLGRFLISIKPSPMFCGREQVKSSRFLRHPDHFYQLWLPL